MKKILTLIAMVGLFILSASAGDKIETNYRTALVMAYSPTNNVYEDDNIKLEIYNECLWATNKTSKTIFIDLSQCFLIHNGTSYPMLDSHLDENYASQKKKSTSIDEFYSISPSIGSKQNETFICVLANKLYGKQTTTESTSKDFTEYDERFRLILNELVNESLSEDPEGKQYLGTSHHHLTEDESISNIGASIAYAFSKRAEEWTSVTITTWVCDVYFAPYYVEMPPELDKKDKRGFGIKKNEAAKVHIKAESPFEFDKDKSPLIVCDWTGNFKKGTFELKETKIKKAGMSNGKLFAATLATIATGGLGAVLFTNINETHYKSELIFEGAEANWGKMTYMNNSNLTQFKVKR